MMAGNDFGGNSWLWGLGWFFQLFQCRRRVLVVQGQRPVKRVTVHVNGQSLGTSDDEGYTPWHRLGAGRWEIQVFHDSRVHDFIFDVTKTMTCVRVVITTGKENKDVSSGQK